MEEEIYQIRLKLIEHFEVEIDLYTQEDHVLLCMERESLIRETFRTPIYTTKSNKELAMILGSYLKREQEDITKAGPSVKQEVGNVVIKKNISVSLPMSKEASKPHDEGHHTQNIMLHNKNKPQKVDPTDEMHVPKVRQYFWKNKKKRHILMDCRRKNKIREQD